MIDKIIFPDGRDYGCDDCKNVIGRFKNEDEACAKGWAVANGRKKCYCPKCAPKHRHVGRKGAPLPLPKDWEQLGIEGI